MCTAAAGRAIRHPVTTGTLGGLIPSRCGPDVIAFLGQVLVRDVRGSRESSTERNSDRSYSDHTLGEDTP